VSERGPGAPRPDASAMVVSLDASGRIVSSNDVFNRVLDLSVKDAKTITIWNLLQPDSWNGFIRVLKRVLEGGRTETLSMMLRSRDGRRVAVEGNLSLKVMEAQPPSVVCTLWDVTDRQVEERGLIAQRNRARFYLDLLTHDINNLNQGVVMCMELILAKDGLPESARSYLERTYDQTLEVSRLIRSIGRLNEMVAESPKGGVVDGRQLVEAAAMRAQVLRKGRRVDVRLTAPTGQLLLVGGQLLEEAFGHLFDFIAKMDPSSTIRIDVGFNLEDDGRRWRVVVEGCGVDQIRAFDSDELSWPDRRDSSVSVTDLGLTIVIEVVTLLGGRIAKEELEGEGTKGPGSAIVLLLERGAEGSAAGEGPSDTATRTAIPW
jgi:PAS domain S-box-containing protein